MHHELQTFADTGSAAKAAAGVIAEHARRAITATGRFSMAVSGGTTPWLMFKELTSIDLPWDAISIYQVDERITGLDDPDRNLTNLQNSLAEVHPHIEPMPVEDQDLEAACLRYGASLPQRIDLMHLGLGPDGHTASLVPGDPVLEVTDRLVALTGIYQGHRRMTLTYPALARGDQLLWLVAGADKKEALSKLLAGDTSIPAGRVEAARSLIIADESAI